MGQKCRLRPGDVINRTYEAVRLLGSGYSGEVWEARHLFLGALVAVKLMHPEDRDNAHKASRFGAEASTLFHLQHEHVVRVLDANATPEGLLFIAMELLQGETLTEKLAKGRIHPLRALKYAYDLACGLDYAHEHGVIHRDIKPDNVFVTLDDIVKLLDFTAAKFSYVTMRTTEPRDRVGTLAYMSPEFMSGTAPADARIDQFSLGMLLYCMLRGQHAFERHFRSEYALMKAVYEEVPEPLAAVAGLPAWIDEMLAPPLAKRVDRRYATMAVFAQRIREAGCRLAREIREGRFTTDVPLGEPAIDFDGDAGDARARKVYVAPQRPARQTTGPVMPSQRITLTPAAPPERTEGAGEDAAFDAAVTAPRWTIPPRSDGATASPAVTVTAPLPGSTTKPVQRRVATARVQRSPRLAAWLAPLALVLALPAAGGVAWRWRRNPQPIEISVQAVPSSPPTAPTPGRVEASSDTPPEPVAPRDQPRAPETPARAAVAVVAVTAVAPAPKPPPKPKLPATPAEPLLVDDDSDVPFKRVQPAVTAKAAPSAAAPAATVTAPPAPATEPAVAPHRVFGTEN